MCILNIENAFMSVLVGTKGHHANGNGPVITVQLRVYEMP